MPEIWPPTVNYIAEADSLQVVPYRRPLATDMEDGQQRRRRSTTKNIATVSFTLRMPNDQFETFKAWVRDDLVDGVLSFTMQVWTGSAYEARICNLKDGTYQDDATKGVFHDIGLALDVEDY
jgi:hypothetical protein